MTQRHTANDMYTREAIRRLKQVYAHCYTDADASCREQAVVLADTLKELGWKPPVDEARMAKARKVAAAVADVLGKHAVAQSIRAGKISASVNAAYDALGDDT